MRYIMTSWQPHRAMPLSPRRRNLPPSATPPTVQSLWVVSDVQFWANQMGVCWFVPLRSILQGSIHPRWCRIISTVLLYITLPSCTWNDWVSTFYRLPMPWSSHKFGISSNGRICNHPLTIRILPQNMVQKVSWRVSAIRSASNKT